jgi:hypothetical protein
MPSLEGLGASDPMIDDARAKLAPAAASGVPSLADLRNTLAANASEIIHHDRAPEGEDMLSEAAGSLMRLVTVRPVGGDVEGESAAARVARAEAKLAEGDLAAAVAEIEQLSGPAAAAAAPWLQDAKLRLDAEVALASLQTRATDLLSRTP